MQGLYLGTREALGDNRRDTITITIDEVSGRSVGALIALYERAVGLYAELINVNAYHQPGVEAGKKAAAVVLELQALVVAQLKAATEPQTAEQIAESIGRSVEVEWVYKILQHLAANPSRGVLQTVAETPEHVKYRAII